MAESIPIPRARPLNPIYAPAQSKSEFFLDRLSEWSTSIPLQTQFCVYIHRFPEAILDVRDLEPTRTNEDWYIKGGFFATTKEQLHNTIGCIFAHGVAVPGESVEVESTGGMGANISGPIINKREDFSNLSIEFLETNTSFTEFVLRPWTILAAHYGLFAYPEGDRRNIKTTITIHQYGKNGAGIRPTERRITTFYDACPVSIGEEEYNYTGEKIVYRSVQFAYSSYAIHDNYIQNREMYQANTHLPIRPFDAYKTNAVRNFG
jgi:hypothetical protein